MKSIFNPICRRMRANNRTPSAGTKAEFANPLNKLIYFENDARGFGFGWPNEAMITDQAADEYRGIVV